MIYLLTRIGDTEYDEYDAKIIRAKTENEARYIANETTGDEGRIWDNATLVKCENIDSDGDACELLGSYNAG
jgi:hypothetical protein